MRDHRPPAWGWRTRRASALSVATSSGGSCTSTSAPEHRDAQRQPFEVVVGGPVLAAVARRSARALPRPTGGASRSRRPTRARSRAPRSGCRRRRCSARRRRPASFAGSRARREPVPLAAGRLSRSTRNVRQSSRPRSQPTRYQRRPRFTSECGSTSRRVARPVAAAVVEPQALGVAAGGGDRRQVLRIDGRARDRRGDRRRPERGDAAAQVRRQHLLELDQRADGRLLDPGHRCARGGAQPDRDRDRLLLVEQQRRHRGAGAQPVAAGRARSATRPG